VRACACACACVNGRICPCAYLRMRFGHVLVLAYVPGLGACLNWTAREMQGSVRGCGLVRVHTAQLQDAGIKERSDILLHKFAWQTCEELSISLGDNRRWVHVVAILIIVGHALVFIFQCCAIIAYNLETWVCRKIYIFRYK